MSDHPIYFLVEHIGEGGIEKVTLQLERELSTNFKNIRLLTFEDKKTALGHPQPTGRHGRLPNFFQLIVLTLKRVITLRRRMKACGSATLVSMGTQMSVIAILACLGLRTKVIASEHFAPRSGLFLKRFLRSLLFCFVYRIHVLTERARVQMPFWLRSKIVVIPNFFDTPEGFKGEQEFRRVIGIGRLMPQKGFDTLIQAFERTSLSELQPWTLHIYGDGPERPHLQKLIERSPASNRIFLEGFSTDVHSEMLHSDIYVLSSRFEGFPLALGEAMQRGLACLAFDCETGPSELIENEKSGILVKPGDTSEMSRQLTRLISDGMLRKRLGRAAQDRMTEFSASVIVGRWRKLLELT